MSSTSSVKVSFEGDASGVVRAAAEAKAAALSASSDISGAYKAVAVRVEAAAQAVRGLHRAMGVIGMVAMTIHSVVETWKTVADWISEAADRQDRLNRAADEYAATSAKIAADAEKAAKARAEEARFRARETAAADEGRVFDMSQSADRREERARLDREEAEAVAAAAGDGRRVEEIRAAYAARRRRVAEGYARTDAINSAEALRDSASRKEARAAAANEGVEETRRLLARLRAQLWGAEETAASAFMADGIMGGGGPIADEEVRAAARERALSLRKDIAAAEAELAAREDRRRALLESAAADRRAAVEAHRGVEAAEEERRAAEAKEKADKALADAAAKRKDEETAAADAAKEAEKAAKEAEKAAKEASDREAKAAAIRERAGERIANVRPGAVAAASSAIARGGAIGGVGNRMELMEKERQMMIQDIRDDLAKALAAIEGDSE